MSGSMDARRWAEIQSAFDEIVELDASERVSRLAAIGAVDPALRDAVRSLLSADAEADSAPRIPDLFGLSGSVVSHFQVLEPLGAGGMGVVYRAEDLRLGRRVALKFLLPQYSLDSAAKARFLHEARSAAALDHPNICTVHEVGESEDGRLFLAMSCYSGETLKTRVAREGALPIDQAIEIATQITRGLARAHEAGIVHRDLKPANLMLTPDGTVRILDFGLAKARDLSLTGPGAVMGTIAYMSPEQLRGEPVDARTDLWNLGVVLFEMLTGRYPFEGDHAAAILSRDVQVGRARTAKPEVPEALARVVKRLLQKDPTYRYRGANELLTDLSALQTSATVRPTRPSGRLPRTWHLWAGVAGVVLVIGVPGFLLWRQTTPQNARAVVAPQSGVSSLAVLPLKNYSGDPAQDYFADGMTDELTTTLTKIAALRVIAHQSMRQFKRSDRSIPEIAGLLDVTHVVDGSVLQDGDRIRITATLIDVARNTPVWSERFERELRDVMALQREVAVAIAKAIAIALTPQDLARLENRPEVDPEAFDLYIKGTQARYRGWSDRDVASAIHYFARAVARDSSYAAAYAGLAAAHAMAGDEARARKVAETALALDPRLAEAHVVLGIVRQLYDWDWVGSEESFRQAIRLNPGFAEAHHELSMLLMRQRRFDEALREAQRTLYLAPMSARFQNGLAEVLLFSGRHDDALRESAKAVALDSTWTTSYWLQGLAYEQRRQYDKAEAAWMRCIAIGCESDLRGELGHLYAVSGRRAEALKIINTLNAQWRVSRKERAAFTGRATNTESGGKASIASGLAMVHAGLGEPEQALEWLERAVETGAFMVYLRIDPAFSPLHAEPRFRSLLKKVGLDDR